MQVRTAVLVPLLALATACTPRQPVVLPAPAPPPAPAMTPEEQAAALARRAELAFDRGVSLGRQGRWADAAAAYRQAAQMLPTEPRYPMALSEALLQQGREWESADALSAAIRAEEASASPNHRVLAVDYERLIRLLTRLNRLDEARTATDRQSFHRRMRDQDPPADPAELLLHGGCGAQRGRDGVMPSLFAAVTFDRFPPASAVQRQVPKTRSVRAAITKSLR